MKPHLLHSIFPSLFSFCSHLGQRGQPLWAKKGVDPSSIFSVLGKRDQLFLTNPYLTLKGLLRSLRAVQTVSKRNGYILIINTNPSLSLLCERFAFFLNLNQVGNKKTNPLSAQGNQSSTNQPVVSKPQVKSSATWEGQDHQSPFPPRGRVFFCCEKWTGGLLSNWGKVFNSVETFSRFSNAFGPFLRENKIQFSNYREMRKRYNGLVGFKLGKLQEESFFLGTLPPKGTVHTGETVCTEKTVCTRETVGTKGLLGTKKKKASVGEKRVSNPLETTLACEFTLEQTLQNSHKSKFAQKSAQRDACSAPNSHANSPINLNWRKDLGLKGQVSQPVPRKRNSNELFTGRNQKPDLIFLINCNENKHVLQEAASLKIPVIGITNTSTNQTGITYPIPGNSESASFVFFCLKWFTAVSTAPTVFSL